jgi:hypothetical protein
VRRQKYAADQPLLWSFILEATTIQDLERVAMHYAYSDGNALERYVTLSAVHPDALTDFIRRCMNGYLTVRGDQHEKKLAPPDTLLTYALGRDLPLHLEQVRLLLPWAVQHGYVDVLEALEHSSGLQRIRTSEWMAILDSILTNTTQQQHHHQQDPAEGDVFESDAQPPHSPGSHEALCHLFHWLVFTPTHGVCLPRPHLVRRLMERPDDFGLVSYAQADPSRTLLVTLLQHLHICSEADMSVLLQLACSLPAVPTSHSQSCSV